MDETLNRTLQDLLQDQSDLLVNVVDSTSEIWMHDACGPDAEVTAATKAELISMIEDLVKRSTRGEAHAGIDIVTLGVQHMKDYWKRRKTVLLAQRGDGPATEELMYRLFRLLPRWLGRYGFKRHIAQDVYQKVAVIVFLKLADLDDPGRFDAWAQRIAKNQAYKDLKKEVIRRPRESREPLPADRLQLPTVVEDLHDRALGQRLVGMLSDVRWAVSGCDDYALAPAVIASAVRRYLVTGITDRPDHTGFSTGTWEPRGVGADDESIAEGLTRYRWRLLSTKLVDQRNVMAGAS